jgi:hypothetical protein
MQKGQKTGSDLNGTYLTIKLRDVIQQRVIQEAPQALSGIYCSACSEANSVSPAGFQATAEAD